MTAKVYSPYSSSSELQIRSRRYHTLLAKLRFLSQRLRFDLLGEDSGGLDCLTKHSVHAVALDRSVNGVSGLMVSLTN